MLGRRRIQLGDLKDCGIESKVHDPLWLVMERYKDVFDACEKDYIAFADKYFKSMVKTIRDVYKGWIKISHVSDPKELYARQLKAGIHAVLTDPDGYHPFLSCKDHKIFIVHTTPIAVTYKWYTDTEENKKLVSAAIDTCDDIFYPYRVGYVYYDGLEHIYRDHSDAYACFMVTVTVDTGFDSTRFMTLE